jgi:hypothetical protein
MNTSTISYTFDEVRLIPDPSRPTEAIGYIDCEADISLDPYSDDHYVIEDLWCKNTAEDGDSRFVKIEYGSLLFINLENSIRHQFGDRPLDALHEAGIA